jgi:hypothetical protein
MCEQFAAGARNLHAVRGALEQAHGEFLFQRLDLGAQRGLAEVQALGRAGQLPGIGDCRKSAKLIQLHGVPDDIVTRNCCGASMT